jgi:hypothetical protein
MEDVAGGVDEDVGDDHAIRGWSPPEAIPIVVPPSKLLPAAAFWHYVSSLQSPPSYVLRSHRGPFL